MIIAEKINLYRNILPYRFVEKENNHNLKEIEQNLTDFFLINNFKIIEETIDNKKFKVCVNEKDKIKITINYKNHITITAIEYENNNENKIYDKTLEIEKMLTKRFNIAYSEKFGYLTPYLFYIPYAIDFEIIFSLYYSQKLNNIEQTLRNLENMGYYVERNFMSIPYLFKLTIIPSFENNIQNVILKTTALIENIKNEERKAFLNYIKKNKLIFKDKIKKLKGYIHNSTIMEYKEAIEIITAIIYAYEVSYIEINKKKEELLKSIFLMKNSHLLNDLKYNSKIVKYLMI